MSVSLVVEWEKWFVYLPYCFVVLGCSDVVEGYIRTHGKKVNTCVSFFQGS